MTGSAPSRYPLLRVISLAIAAFALVVAVTGLVASAAVLAWAVALMALAVFGASYYLKN